MAKRHLTAKEIIKANEYFDQYLKPSKTEGYFEYVDNWSDSKIASVINPDINNHAIANLRLKLVGKLEIGSTDIGTNIKIKELETVVKNLIEIIANLEKKHNLLIDNLVTNRIAPMVAHLKTNVEVKKV